MKWIKKIDKKWRFIHLSFNDYNACLTPVKNSDMFMYKAYLRNGYKCEMIDSLENIDKAICNLLYKDLVRDEKLRQLGI